MSMPGMGAMNPGAMSPADQQKLMMLMQEMQLQDSLRMYNSLVERCFSECVESFRSKKLDTKEETCILKCSEKFVKLAARVGQRFAEHQQEMAQGQAAPGMFK